MQWRKYTDESWMNQEVHTCLCDSDSVYHSINVFTSIVDNGYRKLTQHTAQVRCAAYGEFLYEITLPFGTRIKAAREKAIQLAREANANGQAKFELL